MRIAIDARAFGWAGIGRYTRNLLAGLVRASSGHQYTALVSRTHQAAFLVWQREEGLNALTVKVVDGSYYSWREQTVFWRQLQSVPADLFHFTHFNVPLLFRRPYVVTIHDITRFIFPGQRKQTLFQQVAYEYAFASAVRRARAVIAVSEATRSDMRQLPLKLPEHVRVIPEAVEDVFVRPVVPEMNTKMRMLLGTEQPYFLYVGVWMSHKNLERLLRAFATIAHRHPQVRLVLTGKPKPGYSAVLAMVEQFKLHERIIFAGFVPEHLLPAVYAGSLGFVFISLYEGFGLPALEAAAAGTPVIAANVSSLPEILGDAALFVNPEHVPSVVAAMEKIITNPSTRQELIAKGKTRVRDFSWPAAANEHIGVYESALAGRE